MAKRDINKHIMKGQEIVRGNHRLDLTSADMVELHDIYIKAGGDGDLAALFETIGAAYYTGLAVGVQNSWLFKN